MTEITAVKKQFIVRKRNSGVAFVIMDAPGKVNFLTSSAMDEMEAAVEEVANDPGIKAFAIISGKPDTFVMGADLHEIIKFEKSEQALALSTRGQAILNRIAAMPKPSVSGINGTCLGGGLELALACDARIGTSSEATQLGLPEVRLGFVPGLGGTQRLPRLVGARAGVEMVLSAEPVSAQKALEIGLLNEVVHPDNLLDATEAAALQLLHQGKPEPRNKAADEMPPEKLKSFFAMTERAVRIKTKGKYPAQTRAVEVMQKGLTEGLDAGLRHEAEAFAELSITDVSRNLVFLFFTTEFAKQSALASYEKSSGKRIKTVGIVGGGMMGTAIAHHALINGFNVIMKTMNPDRQNLVAAKLQESIEREDEPGQLTAASGFESLAHADMVIEACAEDEGMKAEVLEKISDFAPADAIIATNTSSLSVSALSKHLTESSRFLGMHFFHPVDRMPLVEMIAHRDTARDTLARASGFISRLGKIPASIKDTPSFLVNRLISCYLRQAGKLPQVGFPYDWVESAATDFGMPMGPYAVADEIGLDLAYECGTSLEKAFGARMTPPELLVVLINNNHSGRKAGAGMYSYHEGKRQGWNPFLSELGLKQSERKATAEELQDIAEHLILPMIDEACRCIDERVVRRPRELDMCVVLGIGFPPFRGGLLRYADTLGAATIIEKLERIYERSEWNTAVSPYLSKLATDGRGFYTRGGSEE